MDRHQARAELIEREKRLKRRSAQGPPLRHRWNVPWPVLNALIFVAAVALVLDLFPKDWHIRQRLETAAPQTPLPTVRRFWRQPTQPNPDRLVISVIDGDTISVAGKPNVRLVGCDAPETGTKAKCRRERELAERATTRLRELVACGSVELTYVGCSCPEGTHGTKACNHGRDCGRLKVAGCDACYILIAEGLARSFVCGGTSCLPRLSWCN
jgi:hypothetical protein